MKKIIAFSVILLVSVSAFAENLHFSLVYASGPALTISGHGTMGNIWINGKKNSTYYMKERGMVGITTTTTSGSSKGHIYILDSKGQHCSLSYSNRGKRHEPKLKVILASVAARCLVRGHLIQIG